MNIIKSILLTCLLIQNSLVFSLNIDVWEEAINQKNIVSQSVSLENRFKDEVELLFVYSSSCGYCKKFAPVFKIFLNNTNLSYTSYTADGGLLPGFENANYSPEIIQKLNVNGYPSVYAVNKISGNIVMFSQGNLGLGDLYTNYNAVASYMYGEIA